MIVTAAVQIHIYPTGRDVIVPVHRHPQIYAIARAFGLRDDQIRRDMDGFLTSDGQFLNREEAAQYALEHGKLKKKLIYFFQKIYGERY